MLEVILFFIATVLLVEWFHSKPKNYPPGPPCIPLLGSSLFVQSKNFHLYLENIKAKYGSVVGFKFGPKYVIGVRGAKEVKEVLSREEFQGRPKLSNIEPGILFSEGEFWSAQRRFALRHLREFGFGKKTVENVVLQEAMEFFQNIICKTEIIQVSGLFSLPIINVLWVMVGGKRYSYNDEELKYLLRCIQRRFRSGNITGGLPDAFPIMRKIFSGFGPFKEEQRTKDLLDEFIEKVIDSHKQTQTEVPRDFIDTYLTEVKNPDLHPSFSELTLRNVCVDLFSAGAESVGNSLSFCLLYCVLYPDWQEQIYQEIQKYDSSEPYLSGVERLAKVEAFLNEVIRCNTIATMTVPHKAVEDTELNGYFIPKDSMLLVSLWSVLQDKDIWEDPENFRPERFLDENGKFNKKVGWFPAFGHGKRHCLGETLARNITFVFLIILIREFKFSIPEGHPRPSTLCMPGFTNAPQPFFVKITKRLKSSHSH